MRMLDPSELAERGLPRCVACGYLEERGGVLHPGKYVRALREQAIEAGVRLHESTPVDAIADGPRVRVETPRGSASAPVCVVATNAYTPRLGRLRSAVAPLHVSLFATEPLSRRAARAGGLAGGEGIYTAHEVLESYRLTADGRIVGGSRHVRWSYGGRTLPDDDPEVFAALEAMFRARFPELADVAVERCWSGPIAMTLDFLPAIGRSGRHDNSCSGSATTATASPRRATSARCSRRWRAARIPAIPSCCDAAGCRCRRSRCARCGREASSARSGPSIGAPTGARCRDRMASAARSPKRRSTKSRRQPRPDAGGGQWSEGRPQGRSRTCLRKGATVFRNVLRSGAAVRGSR